MSRLLRYALTMAAVLSIAAAIGCGSDDDNSGAEATTTAAAPAATTAPSTETAGGAAGTGGGGPTTATVKVDADPDGQLAFVQKSLTAPAGNDTFRLSNASTVPHNLEIEGNGIEAGPTATISGGETAELKVDLKPGTYEFYCAVPGHKEAGMEGTLTVE
jgi:uncharacterized cupredoxin-like copper-binding protein